MDTWNTIAEISDLSQIQTDFQGVRTRYSSVILMTNFNSFIKEALNQMKIFA